mgnify:CR=1 FL=1
MCRLELPARNDTSVTSVCSRPSLRRPEQLASSDTSVTFVPTADNHADVLTKHVDRGVFQRHRAKIFGVSVV